MLTFARVPISSERRGFSHAVIAPGEENLRDLAGDSDCLSSISLSEMVKLWVDRLMRE
jgi:hypothetical protein